MKTLLIVLLLLFVGGCSGPSDELKQRAQTACEKFVLEKIANQYGDETHIFDTYIKKDKIVVEVGYRATSRSYGEDSYSVRKCLYDDEAGTISIPSIIEMGQWNK